MATKIEICNMALAHLGAGNVIASIDERSEEARALKQFWDIAFESFCREFSFPFTKVIADLQLVEENPNEEWLYSYRYPNNCLVIKRILSGDRNDTHETRVVFTESHDNVGKLIFTDKEEAQVEYVSTISNPAHFAPDFALALSYKLAYLIAPRIAGGDAYAGLTKNMLQLYMMQAALAKSSAANEVQPDVLPESEFIRSRY